MIKNQISNAEYYDTLKLFTCYEYVDGKQQKPESAGLFMRNLSRVTALLFFKRNRTVRDLKDQYDITIEKLESYPPELDRLDRQSELYTERPRLNNLCGWLYISITQPASSCYQRDMLETAVMSDLISIELREKQGAAIKLKDRFTEREYVKDEESGLHKSAGPDRILNSDDDIILE